MPVTYTVSSDGMFVHAIATEPLTKDHIFKFLDDDFIIVDDFYALRIIKFIPHKLAVLYSFGRNITPRSTDN